MNGLCDISRMRQVVIGILVFAVAHFQRVHEGYEDTNRDLQQKTRNNQLLCRIVEAIQRSCSVEPSTFPSILSSAVTDIVLITYTASCQNGHTLKRLIKSYLVNSSQKTNFRAWSPLASFSANTSKDHMSTCQKRHTEALLARECPHNGSTVHFQDSFVKVPSIRKHKNTSYNLVWRILY